MNGFLANRLVPALLLGLLLVLHAQIWFGRGSVSNVADLRQQLAETEQRNLEDGTRNQQLANEVSDLREGLDMVEELARQELGMLKPNEIFIQIAQKR